jgi:fructose-specific phosphotransferase system IIC component
MIPMELNRPSYPMLECAVRYGDAVAALCSVAVAIAGCAWLFLKGGIWIGLGALAVAVVVYVVAYVVGRTLSELVRLVVDMLLPN